MRRVGGPPPVGRRIELDPARRHPVTRVEAVPGVARMMLDRASGSAEREEPSQDFVVFEHAPSHLCFVVADGVGSSFLGDLAARFLAQRTIDWLSSLEGVPDAEQLAAELTTHLRELEGEANEMVDAYEIGQELMPYMVDVLQRQRAYGSEAMFVCGRIDWPGHGSESVGVAWLGDGQLRVLLRGGGCEDLRGRTADRWSTRRGARGEISARVWPLRQVERVIACTDGMLPAIDAAVGLSDEALDARLGALAAHESSDDMALVDVALIPEAMPPASGGRATAPAPRRDHGKREPPPEALRDGGASLAQPEWLPAGRDHGLSWRPVDGADGYTVQFAESPEFGAPVTYQIASTTFLAPDLWPSAWVRVRADAGDRAGPWGESRAVEQAVLPAPRGLRVQPDVRRGGLEVSWDAVGGAESYLIRLQPLHGPHDPPTEQRVPTTRAHLSLATGDYRISARADASGRRAEWTDALTIRVFEERWR